MERVSRKKSKMKKSKKHRKEKSKRSGRGRQVEEGSESEDEELNEEESYRSKRGKNKSAKSKHNRKQRKQREQQQIEELKTEMSTVKTNNVASDSIVAEGNSSDYDYFVYKPANNCVTVSRKLESILPPDTTVIYKTDKTSSIKDYHRLRSVASAKERDTTQSLDSDYFIVNSNVLLDTQSPRKDCKIAPPPPRRKDNETVFIYSTKANATAKRPSSMIAESQNLANEQKVLISESYKRSYPNTGDSSFSGRFKDNEDEEVDEEEEVDRHRRNRKRDSSRKRRSEKENRKRSHKSRRSSKASRRKSAKSSRHRGEKSEKKRKRKRRSAYADEELF